MMRNFRVTVNGNTYDVAVEEVANDGSVAASAPVQQAAPQVAAPKKAEPKKAATPAGKEGAVKLTAPMPGNIADVKVNVGDTVKKDQVGVVLEAMKMENEVFIPADGKVVSVNVEKGAVVKTGDVLLTIE